VPWLSHLPGGDAITRPPAAHAIAAVRAQLLAHRQGVARHLRRGTNIDEPDRLCSSLQTAADRTAELTRCRRCSATPPQPDRTLAPREDGTFRCTCITCGAAWETRVCQSCHGDYPVLETSLTTETTEDAGMHSRVMAVPVVEDEYQVFRCPSGAPALPQEARS
jgi:hypothetical protein